MTATVQTLKWSGGPTSFTAGLKNLPEFGAPAPSSDSQCHKCDERAKVWSAPDDRTVLNIDDVDVELDLIGWCAYCAWHKDEE